MTSPSFARVATVTASTKRPPSVSGGKGGVPVTNIASLNCTRPADASDAKELRETYKLGTLVYLQQVFVQDNLDVQTDDTLVIASGDWAGTYPIRIVQRMGFGSDIRKRLIIEGLKR